MTKRTGKEGCERRMGVLAIERLLVISLKQGETSERKGCYHANDHEDRRVGLRESRIRGRIERSCSSDRLQNCEGQVALPDTNGTS